MPSDDDTIAILEDLVSLGFTDHADQIHRECKPNDSIRAHLTYYGEDHAIEEGGHIDRIRRRLLLVRGAYVKGGSLSGMWRSSKSLQWLRSMRRRQLTKFPTGMRRPR